MFEGTYSPPFYLDLYNFKDGAQDDIFSDSYAYLPTPGVSQTQVPTPIDHPVPTDRSRNSAARMVGNLRTLDTLVITLFSVMALYAGGVF